VCMLNRGIVGSCSFNLLRILHTIFHNNYANLHSPQRG
jgi:hypothetical protein